MKNVVLKKKDVLGEDDTNVIFGQLPFFLIYLATENIQIYDSGTSLKGTTIKIINRCFLHLCITH